MIPVLPAGGLRQEAACRTRRAEAIRRPGSAVPVETGAACFPWPSTPAGWPVGIGSASGADNESVRRGARLDVRASSRARAIDVQ